MNGYGKSCIICGISFFPYFLSFSSAIYLIPIKVLGFIAMLYFDSFLLIFDNCLTLKPKVYFCFTKEKGKLQAYLGMIYKEAEDS